MKGKGEGKGTTQNVEELSFRLSVFQLAHVSLVERWYNETECNTLHRLLDFLFAAKLYRQRSLAGHSRSVLWPELSPALCWPAKEFPQLLEPAV